MPVCRSFSVGMASPTCRATLAFGSGQRAGTELSLALGMSRYSTKLNEITGSPQSSYIGVNELGDEGNECARRSARAEKCEGLNASYVPTQFPITTSGIPLRGFSSCLSSAVKSVDNLCLILKRTVFRIGCSTETLAILAPSTTIRTYVFYNNNFVKKNRCDDHANMVFAHKLIESLCSFVS